MGDIPRDDMENDVNTIGVAVSSPDPVESHQIAQTVLQRDEPPESVRIALNEIIVEPAQTANRSRPA
jgi:hypothetical protein